MLHGPAYGGPELGAGLAQPAADVDDGGDGGGGEGEGEVLLRDAASAGAAEGDDGEVDVEGHGHPLVRRGGPRELRRRLEQAREALREAVRKVLAVPLHALPRLEGDLHARRGAARHHGVGVASKSGVRGRRIGADGRRRGIGDGKGKGRRQRVGDV